MRTKFRKRDIFLRYLSLASLGTKTLDLKRQTEMKGSGSIVSKFIGYPFFQPILRFLNYLLLPSDNFYRLFRTYQPSLVFSTDVQNELDIGLMEEAKRFSVRTVGMVRSWDNLTSKGILRCVPDVLLVGNEVMKHEAVAIQGILSEKVAVVGVPHYDRYFKHETIPKKLLEEKIGLPPESRFVLFAPTGNRYISDNTVDEYIFKLIEKELPPGWSLVVRLPPTDMVQGIETGLSSARIKIYRPGENFGTVKTTELSRHDDALLVAMLREAGVVVTGPSTLCIDAAIFDVPVILVGFDGESNRPYLESTRRYYDYNHFDAVKASGGVRIAGSPEEFKTLLHGYINNKSLDRDGRRTLVQWECGFVDGRSSHRILEILKENLEPKK